MNSRVLYFQPSQPHLLLSDGIDVWCASLDREPQRFYKFLSQDEQARADRFYFERDRSRFIISRGLLRTILGYYLNIDPSKIQFCYGPHGKPALQSTFHKRVVHFNLSHSHDLALYAVSWNRQVGIDVEYIRPMLEAEHIANHFFSRDENTLIRTLPAAERTDLFFKIWTSKEAYLKAIGGGLTESLTQIEISLASTELTRIVSIDGDWRNALPWHLETLNPAPNYLAALVVQGSTSQIVFRHIPNQDSDPFQAESNLKLPMK